MTTKQPKVFLAYSVSEERYYVERIQGSVPAIEYQDRTPRKEGGAGPNKSFARVGSILSEAQVGYLGHVADLTIKRHTI